MKKRKIFLFPAILLAITFLTSIGFAQTQTNPNAPVITHSFAVEKGYYGIILKIYLEAEDPDGDMFKIATVVDQTGYGRYPTDWIIIKPQFKKGFKGYIQWNTFSPNTSYLKEWNNITIRVSIFDKAGNESNEAVLPFTFETGIKNPYSYQLPAPFDQGDLPRLGYVHINLYEPTLMGNGNGRRDD